MKTKTKTKTKICVICGKKFLVRCKNSNYGRAGKNVRRRDARACSGECARIFSRRLKKE